VRTNKHSESSHSISLKLALALQYVVPTCLAAHRFLPILLPLLLLCRPLFYDDGVYIRASLLKGSAPKKTRLPRNEDDEDDDDEEEEEEEEDETVS